VALGLLSLVAASLVGGCGSSDEPPHTVTVERQVTVEKPRPRKLKRTRDRTPPASTTAATPAYVNCDSNIQAKASTTTCPFAENVFWTYWSSGQASSLQVWSPAAHTTFATACDSEGTSITCTTSDGGAVRFSQAAIDSYSQDQADAYASSHDLGPDPDAGLADSGGGGEGGGAGDDCQGYDPCISPGPDVDCASGSGNGPRYVDGPVYVNGDDPYGLDSDGNGMGCQSG
jgi:hypothetical protein